MTKLHREFRELYDKAKAVDIEATMRDAPPVITSRLPTDCRIACVVAAFIADAERLLEDVERDNAHGHSLYAR